MAIKFDVILLAGNRPEGEILSQNAGTSCKALVPIAGKPMLYYPLKTLLNHCQVNHIWVLHQDIYAFDNDNILSAMISDPRITMYKSGKGISSSIAHLINEEDSLLCPLLVTTGDNVLLNSAMLDDFSNAAAGHNVAVAMVESKILLAQYPQSQRTWLKFKGGKWSGANMFWLGDRKTILPLLKFWQSIEQDRKKGLKIIGAFGLPLLLASLLRLITLPDALKKVGARFGVDAKLVAMTQAHACIDVDKPADVILTESILEKQQ